MNKTVLVVHYKVYVMKPNSNFENITDRNIKVSNIVAGGSAENADHFIELENIPSDDSSLHSTEETPQVFPVKISKEEIVTKKRSKENSEDTIPKKKIKKFSFNTAYTPDPKCQRPKAL